MSACCRRDSRFRSSSISTLCPQCTEQPELWKPFALWNEEATLEHLYAFACIARIRPGVPASQALADLNAVQTDLARQAPQRGQLQARLIPLQEQIVSRSRSSLTLMLVAVALVLIIGCVNVAHLLFARGSGRHREVVVRRAIGATTGRLVWQLVAESLLISALGGLVGVVAAFWAVRLIQGSATLDIPRVDEVAVNGRVLLFTLVTSLAAGLLAGILPAWHLAKTDPLDSIRSSISAAGRTKARGVLRWLLVSLEVGVSTMCLVMGGLLLHSFVKVLRIDPGFTEQHAVVVPLNVAGDRYRNAAARVALSDRLLERVRQVHGVISAGIASRLPLHGEVGGTIFSVEGTSVPRLERPIVAVQVIDPWYFGTAGIPLQAGRLFEDRDRNRRQVAIVAAAVADRAWPGQNPVGQRFRLDPNPDHAPLIEVVGVVGSVRGVSLTDGPTLDVYVPYWQSDMALYSDQLSMVIGTAEEGSKVWPMIQRAIRDTDGELPVPAFHTMDDLADASLAERRFELELMLFAAAAALLLACLGIYGVVSHAVALRTNEIGIRMALGGDAAAVERLVFAQSVVPVAAGLGVGAIASMPVGGLLRSLLFGITPRDPLSLSAAVALLAAVAVATIYVPARRATRVDPVRALRCD